MKIALGIMTFNEREILQRTLLHSFDFQYKYAVDFFSSDLTVELLGSFGFLVHSQKWPDNFAAGRNILIQYAEDSGADYLFMLDADEAMTPEGIRLCIEAAEKYDCIALPRIEFVKDTNHYDPTLYPDYQCRFFRLKKGYYFRNRVHEMLHHPVTNKAVLADPRKFIALPNAPIYHYSRIKDHRRLALKYLNYDRMAQNQELLKELPVGYDPQAQYWARCEPFIGDHPLKKSV